MDTKGGGTAPPVADTTVNAGGSGTAGSTTEWNSSRASRETGSGTAGPVAKADYRNYHQGVEWTDPLRRSL